MFKIIKSIKNKQYEDVMLAITEGLYYGRLSKWQVYIIEKKIDQSEGKNRIFSKHGYHNFEDDIKKWDKNYLMRLQSNAINGSFDEKLLKHMTEVSCHVYRIKHLIGDLLIIGLTTGVVLMIFIGL